ncbi:MAG: TonB-dependent receptor [Thiohalocapsa sp.]
MQLAVLLVMPAIMAAMLLLPAAAAAQTAAESPNPAAPPTLTLPTVEVVGTTPLPGIGIDRDKVPANVQTLSAPPDIARQGPAPLTGALQQGLASVNLNGNEDNPYQPDLQYRGFTATSVVGTPIGLAVYQNGVRLNEPFGDSVGWDLVPQFAIDRLNVMPTNPVFGLNALGGAIVVNMKNGFNFAGGQAELFGGSFGTRQFTLQYGKRVGDIGAYIGATDAHEDGFRKLSPSLLRQLYADVGAEGDGGSVHLSLTGANNRINGLGPTPIELVDRDRSSVFVSPQLFSDTLLMASLNGNYIASDTLSLQSNLYVRSSGRKAFAGNITDAQVCGEANPGLLCLGDSSSILFDANGQPVMDVLGGATPGENDASSITSLGLGGSLQATYSAPLFGHDNHLVVGAAIDHGDVDFTSTNELAVINPHTLVTRGLGIIIQQPDGSLTPIRLETTNSYYGFYASDTFNVTPELALTLGGRYNIAQIRLIDKIGSALNGNNRFSRFNPAAGFTYKVTPEVTGYFGYAEANRAPTAGELGCSDPARPCSLDAFVSADPPGLRQVVAHNYEVGLRGKFSVPLAELPGGFDWNVGLFRTDLDDDILTVPSDIVSAGYFRNVGGTRRQGIEAALGYKDATWQFGIGYSLIDATFQTAVLLSSPNNPFADANGDIHVKPGDRLPGIPLHRFKLNADYAITDKWSVGGALMFFSDQYYFNDQSNQNPTLPGYLVVNLRTSYKVTPNLEFYALVNNLFDNKYYTYGIFNDPTRTPLPGVPHPTDPRFVSIAPPLAAYGGLRIRF